MDSGYAVAYISDVLADLSVVLVDACTRTASYSATPAPPAAENCPLTWSSGPHATTSERQSDAPNRSGNTRPDKERCQAEPRGHHVRSAAAEQERPRADLPGHNPVQRTALDNETYALPETLLAALDDAQSVAARLSAAVYRTSIALHRTAAPGVRRWLLSLDAARYGAVELLADLTDPVPARSWVPKWATGSQISTALRHTLSGHEGGVPVVACTIIDGRPTAVTGGQDGTARRWDLATGHPVRAPMGGTAVQ